MEYRPDIDGLRAISVAGVVAFHAGVPGVPGGFVGVDVFFVISGFLVARLMQPEGAAATPKVGAFLERRIRRLLPAMVVIGAVAPIAGAWLLAPRALQALGASVAAMLLGGGNVYFWRTSNYFAESAEFLPLLHTWSLGVEQQYYVVAALVAGALARSSKDPGAFRARHLLVTALLTVASFAFSWWSVKATPGSTFFLLPARFWEMGLGATLGLVPGLAPGRSRGATVMVVAGVAAIAAAMLTYDGDLPFPGPYAAVPALGAASVIVGGIGGAGPASRALGHPALRWLGTRSYSFYLWHWPLLVYARNFFLRPLSPGETLGLVALALALSEVTFRHVEERWRRSSIPAYRFAAVSAALGGVLALFLHATHGLPRRFPKATAVAAVAAPTEHSAPRCSIDSRQTAPAWGGDDCILHRGGDGGRRVLLWGDSLAGHYRPGFTPQTASAATIWQYTTTVCPPILGWSTAARPGCRQFNERAANLLEEGRFDAVVIAARWQNIIARPGTVEAVRATLDRLIAHGIDVFVVGQTPVFPLDAEALYLRTEGGEQVADFATATHVRVNERLRTALPPGAHFIDAASALCAGDRCQYRADGQFLFSDNVHLSPHGAALVVERALLPALALPGR